VALIAFTLFRFVGDPINQMVGLETTAAERAQLREALGLNDPVVVQFARFVWHALHLDFGVSYQFKQPVVTLIGERFPPPSSLPSSPRCSRFCSAFPWGCTPRFTADRGSLPYS